MQHTQKFVLYAAGIFVIYFYFGILQEKITRSKYNLEITDAEGNTTVHTQRFTFALTLCCIQCIVNFIIAKVTIFFWPQKNEDKTAKLYYASVSITYLLAMVASNMALQWVPYPTQVVGKSAKPIPVLILGVLVGKKSYALRKYLFIFIIVIGIVLFMLKDRVKQETAESAGLGVGELLLFLSLLMDGLTGAIQERIRAESRPSGFQMMLSQNGWSSLFLVGTILISGEFFKFMEFAKQFPYIHLNLLALGIASAVGQLFLFSMVSDFGPLPLSIVTTTRKFFTVLGSVILFGNSLSGRQWFGAVLVFVGLFLDAYYGKAPPKKDVAR